MVHDELQADVLELSQQEQYRQQQSAPSSQTAPTTQGRPIHRGLRECGSQACDTENLLVALENAVNWEVTSANANQLDHTALIQLIREKVSHIKETVDDLAFDLAPAFEEDRRELKAIKKRKQGPQS